MNGLITHEELSTALSSEVKGAVQKTGATMTGALTLNADPTSSLQAATKQYVDAIKQGLDVKESVRIATTGAITLSGLQTIDGVVAVANDRVLVKDQASGAQNGIYLAAEGAWSRASDADTSIKVTTGMYTFVEDGTINAGSGWTLVTKGPINLGVTALSFNRYSGAGQIIAGDGLSKSGNQLDVVVDNSSIEIVSDALQLKAGGTTDAHLGNRTITDTNTPTADAGTLTNLFSWLGNMIKSITGKASWRTAPATTLEAANVHFTDKAKHIDGNDACSVYISATQNIANGTNTAIAFNAEEFDTSSMHDNATNNSRITCKTKGVYLIIGNVSFAGTTNGTVFIGNILHNGTSIVSETGKPANASNGCTLSMSILRSMEVNEYVELWVYQDSGSALNATTATKLSMIKIG